MKESKKRSAYSKFDDEHSVAVSIHPKTDSKIRMRKLLFILLYAGYVALWGVLLVVLRTFAVYLGTFSLVSLVALIFFTWRYTQIEYEMAIHKGQLGFAVIYGERSRKELFSCPIHDLKIIAPYNEENRGQAERCNPSQTKIFVADIRSPENYFAIYESQDGSKTLLIFEALEKSLKMLKYYNRAAFAR